MSDKLMQSEVIQNYFTKIFKSDLVESMDPWFKSYCSNFLDSTYSARFFGYRKHMVEMSGITPTADKSFLDAGCGFGPNLLSFHLMGFGAINGIDIYAPMIEAINMYLPLLNLQDKIMTKQGDVCNLSKLYPSNSIDLVLSNEAISHYYDIDRFLQEAYFVLKPGGALIISDNNNGLNAKTKKMNQEIWDAFENGPAGPIHGHTVKKPYIQMRKDIIYNSHPKINQQDIEVLASSTFCMSEAQIIDATNNFINKGQKPTSFYRPDICPLEPYQNQVIENLIYPDKITNNLKKKYTSAKAYAYLGGATKGGMASKVNRLWEILSPITLPYSKAFFIIAHK